MLDPGIMPDEDVAYSATVAHQSRAPLAGSSPPARGSSSTLALSARATVLPRLARTGEPVEHMSGAPRFVPVRLLGTGGMGEVTLVQDNDIDRPVALKRLRGDASDELVHRFAEEIRTVGQLEHPNIAPVHDVGVDDGGNHYFVMRYIDGETLEAIISKLAAGDAAYHARFTFAHRVQVFLGALNAIAYAHSKDIIHRDIKPSNIIVGPYGEVVVMDWGVAKKRGAPARTEVAPASATPHEARELYRTQQGSLVGTPAYMSPEQAAGCIDEIDERSDVYALAVVLYELLSLQHYLPGRTTVTEMLAAIAGDAHVMACYLPNPHQSPVPAELAWFIEKGLARDPDKRFQTVAEMSERLERAMAGVFPVQCPITLVKKTATGGLRFLDRHPAVGLIGLAALLALIVVGVVHIASALL
jgi:serine/threonine-protein kinase